MYKLRQSLAWLLYRQLFDVCCQLLPFIHATAGKQPLLPACCRPFPVYAVSLSPQILHDVQHLYWKGTLNWPMPASTTVIRPQL